MAWRLMGRTLDWAAFPHVCALLGEDDTERLVYQLVALRDRNWSE